MPANISEFRSVIFNRQGLSKLDRFRLRMPIPATLAAMQLSQGTIQDTNRFMEFFCNTTDLPGVALATENITRYGYGSFEKKPHFAIFNDVMLTFLNDSKSQNLQYFQQWMASIVDFKFPPNQTVAGGTNETGAGMFELNYKRDYAVDASLTLLNDHDDEMYIIVMRDFFPTMIPETKMAWETTNQFFQLVVMFSFTDWYLDRPEALQ